MGTASRPPGKAAYVASQSDWDWLRNEQQKLYERSRDNLDYVFRKLWGLMTDARNLRVAVARVARNKGRRTAGVDGITAGKALRRGVDDFVGGVRAELRSGEFRPSPARRVLIPKQGKPGSVSPSGNPHREG